MSSPTDRYRACAATCAGTDYNSPASVRRHNAAANRMRGIIEEAAARGPAAVGELLPLLDEEPSARWLAFHLLELSPLPPAERERCLAVIRRLAVGSSAEALGADVAPEAHRRLRLLRDLHQGPSSRARFIPLLSYLCGPAVRGKCPCPRGRAWVYSGSVPVPPRQSVLTPRSPLP